MEDSSVSELAGDETFDGAITKARADVNSSPPVTPENLQILLDRYLSLANALFERYERYHHREDLDESLSWEEKALQLTADGHTDRPMYLHNLAVSHLSLALDEEDSDHAFLNKAIDFGYAAIEAAGSDHPSIPQYHSTLSTALLHRIKHAHGSDNDLDASIRFSQSAVSVSSADVENDDTSMYRLNLSNALMLRYSRSHSTQDLDGAIAAAQAAAQGPFPSKSIHTACIANLGAKLAERYSITGRPADLEAALPLCWEAVGATPDDHPGLQRRQLNLGNALFAQFELRHDRVDLDTALDYLSRAAEPSMSGDQRVRRRAYLCLSMVLMTRYDNSLAVEDVQQAVVVANAAVALTHIDEDATGDMVDADTAISFSNLSSALLTLYGIRNEVKDLEDALIFSTKAVDVSSPLDLDRPMYLNNMGVCYFRMYQRHSNLRDLEMSIEKSREATASITNNHPDQARWTSNLAQLLLISPSDSPHVDEAYSLLREVATSTTASPRVHFHAARQWAAHAHTHQRYLHALDAYKLAFHLVPQLVWIGANLKTRQELLPEANGLAADATACALEYGDLELAVYFFEQGRDVLWSQVLRLRTDIGSLREVNPTLADRFMEVVSILERTSLRECTQKSFADGPSPSLTSSTRRQRQAAEDWFSLLDEIRNVDGFINFLVPPSYAQLKGSASHGPVVLLNCSRQRCDALIILSPTDSIGLVPLTIGYDAVQELSQRMCSVKYSQGSRHWKPAKKVTRTTELNRREDMLSEVLKLLWDTIAEPVLAYLDRELGHDPSRHLYWCMNGPLSSLPIHAAGVYNIKFPTSNKDNLLDRAISSFIPTISSLLYKHSMPFAPFHLLAVGVTAAPGVSTLPCTADELKAIRAIVPDSNLVVLEDEHATVSAVQDAIPRNSWVHFACHGLQADYTHDVFKSRLLLYDGSLVLSSVAEAQLPHAQVVFLSACESAMGDGKLSDESAHLAGGMLLAGFRGAVATLWPIHDQDGPKVAGHVYSWLFSEGTVGGEPDPTRVAEALQYAVRRLRDSKVPLLRWAPFVYFGV